MDEVLTRFGSTAVPMDFSGRPGHSNEKGASDILLRAKAWPSTRLFISLLLAPISPAKLVNLSIVDDNWPNFPTAQTSVSSNDSTNLHLRSRQAALGTLRGRYPKCLSPRYLPEPASRNTAN